MRGVKMAWVAVVALGLALTIPSPGTAQIPTEFTNLKLLPKDIGRGELVGIRREFAGALGTNCGHCHVGENPATLEDFDFASDEKETKRVARIMYEMVQSINGEHLPRTGRENTVEVTCATCHHSFNKPTDLGTQLMAAHEEGGMDALVARYDELREQYYGRAVFDFGEGSLTSLSSKLARLPDGGMADAVAVLRMNIELFPESQSIYWQLGQTLVAKGDSAEALTAFKTGKELDPNAGGAQFFQQWIDRLGGGE